MKWKKQGQIFEFEKENSNERFISHAQSPQAVVFDNFIRIYYSTREKDEKNKFLSRVQFVDFDKTFKKIINKSSYSVIKRGEPGTFDEHGIFPFSPFKYKDKIYAYTTGWSRRVSVSVETGIGLAISNDDGKTYEKIGNGPILTSSLNEPFLVCDGYVKYYEHQFYMWYIYGTNWKIYKGETQPERTYKIGCARSNDGINWQKEGKQIIPSVSDDECQALPTVIKIGNKYHMYFCYRKSYNFRTNPENSYRLGYAYSEDLINWIRDDENCGINVSKRGWDSEMICYPNLFESDNEIYLLYNGNEFGKYGFGIAILENK